jgi:hypothetical protein
MFFQFSQNILKIKLCGGLSNTKENREKRKGTVYPKEAYSN